MSDEFSRGSGWNRWDLHVHTPASYVQHYGDGNQDSTWEQYISELEALPSDICTIGVSDYFTIDGYSRLLDAKLQGRLGNLALILPMVELRITTLVGGAETRKLNVHVVFSDELTPELIRSFFLNLLEAEIHLGTSTPWRGCVGHIEGIENLGRAVTVATPASKRQRMSPAKAGFATAAVSKDTLLRVLNNSVFHGKYLLAVGLREWDQMGWDGAGGPEKRDLAMRADFILTAAPTAEQYHLNRDQLESQIVNSHLLHASDAHFYAESSEPNRLGHTFCWLKADPTFLGLRRALSCFGQRVFIGETPPKLSHVRQNRTKFIDRISIHKKTGIDFDENWFDVDIPLNTDLIAIIGNQGSGKSALMDIAALCGSASNAEYSFLTREQFRDSRARAEAYEATISWCDGTVSSIDLCDSVSPQAVERVRYVPQAFFERLTNEKHIDESSHFYGEIKKAVFSHIPVTERLNCTDFDSLVSLGTTELERRLTMRREEMSRLNREIIRLEEACARETVLAVENQIAQRHAEIEALRAAEPAAVPVPTETAVLDERLSELRILEVRARTALAQSRKQLALRNRQFQVVRDIRQRLDTEVLRVQQTVSEIQEQLTAADIPMEASGLIVLTLNSLQLDAYSTDLETQILALAQTLDSEEAESKAHQEQALRTEREGLERRFEDANSGYQHYLSELQDWNELLVCLSGDEAAVTSDSLLGLEEQLRELTEVFPSRLEQMYEQRREVCGQIHAELVAVAGAYDQLTLPVQKHIQSNELTRERYRLQFSIRLKWDNLAKNLFSIVRQDMGTFSPVEAGRRHLDELIEQCDAADPISVVAFIESIVENLKFNSKRNPPEPVDLASLVSKKGGSPQSLYDLLFGLINLRPEFNLILNDKPHWKLSPGERGILLLVFYLIVDRGDEPLLFDQPEGNLNNQAIYDHLIPVFQSAKERRQIIIVTHNPNLAVVCDAEQVIHARMNAADGHRITYTSGSLEHPDFNRLSLDLLEGTLPAFRARRDTYFVEQSPED